MGWEEVQARLRATPKRWLVSGAAGFIGSNITEHLLTLDQPVVGLDNFSTGHQSNLEDIKSRVSSKQWERFTFIDADICDQLACKNAVAGIDVVLHQAALGSVPRSLLDPLRSNESNVTGFLTLLSAAKEAGVNRFVYASSSSVYGDAPELPKLEDKIGNLLSPYAATKRINELYADVFARSYGIEAAGLRYFNVFGPRQDPNGAYAAVIPKWIQALLSGEQCVIFGDGETSRDFCYVDNVIQANILAGVATLPAPHRVYNIAIGEKLSLTELQTAICNALKTLGVSISNAEPLYQNFRAGDIRHSLAAIDRAKAELGYVGTCRAQDGLVHTVTWFVEKHSTVKRS